MNTVTFPMLNLKLNIDNVAFSIFGIDIYWYAIFIVSAMLIALLILKKRQGLYNIKYQDIIDLFIYLLPIAIISARLYYVIFNFRDYINDPLQILNIRTGGLAIYGGIIGGIITCLVFCKKRKINILDLLDYIVPCLALRTGYWKMGKFCKYRGIWNKDYFALENGNI